MKRFFFATLLLLAIYLYTEKDPTVTSFEGIAMTIPYRILVGDPVSFEQAELIENRIQKVFTKTHQHFNKWNKESELTLINRTEAGIEIAVSEVLMPLLKITDRLYRVTEGRFDPTVEAAQEIWKETFLEETPTLFNWSDIELKQNSLIKTKSGLQIDLGGIAKGYCLDLMKDAINELGFHNLLIEWGGDFVACGKHPKKRGWQVGIRSFTDGEVVETIELNNAALATSGDYLQKWDLDDRSFSHIFDPLTGLPMEIKTGGIGSVSVLSSNATEADALATALMLFESEEEAKEWISSIDEPIQVRFINH